MLRGLSLKTSLISALGLLVLLLLLQGMFGLTSMRGIFGNLESVANNALPAVDITNRLNISIANLRGLQTRHVLAKPGPAMESAEAAVVKEIGKLKERMARYEPMISSEKERVAFAGFKQASEEYLRLNDKLITLSKSGQKDVAAALLTGDMVSSYNKMDDLADDFRDANVEAAQRMYQESATAFRWSLAENIIILAIGAVAGITAVGFVLREVSLPIQQTTGLMLRLAKGDLTIHVPFLDRKNEVGDMARAVEVFKQNGLKVQAMNAQEERMRVKCDELRDAIGHMVAAALEGDFNHRMTQDFEFPDLNAFAASMNELVENIDTGLAETRRVIAALSDGDLTDGMRGQFTGAFAELQRNVNSTMEILRGIVSEVRNSIDMIQSGSGELRFASDDLAKRTEQQAAALEETSSALEEITTAVNESTGRAQEASRMVDEARRSTEASGAIVGDAVSAMERIETASGQISQIISVIDEIAFQTNLLALNAGVEAARAGEAGKGFAVVAQEVRELAQRSAGAAKDIKALITKSGEEVGSGVRLVTATGDALSKIRDHVDAINHQVHQIAATAREQSTRLQEVNSTVGQMDQVTQRNAAMVEETTASTNRLADDATTLARLIGHFKLDARGHASASHAAANGNASRRPQPKTASGGRNAWKEY